VTDFVVICFVLEAMANALDGYPGHRVTEGYHNINLSGVRYRLSNGTFMSVAERIEVYSDFAYFLGELIYRLGLEGNEVGKLLQFFASRLPTPSRITQTPIHILRYNYH